MLIWFAMVVPLVTAIFLYFGFHHRTLWWELLIPTGVSLLLVLGFKAGVEAFQTSDTEYWTGAIVKAEYYEDWDETVPCSHPKYQTVVNADGTTDTVFVGYEHFFDVDDHPAYWQVIDSNGIVVSISKNHFKALCDRFGNKKFIDLHRDYYSDDGDKHVTIWGGHDKDCEACTTWHKYENRIIAGNSVFKFPEVTEDEKEGLFEYPPIEGYHTPFILGDGGPTQEKAEHKLAVWNARNGRDKQCRMIFLVYKNESLDIALTQENYWQGGNKNEFIVAVGADDDYRVQWVHVMSWTEDEVLKAKVKQVVRDQEELDLIKMVDTIGPMVQEKFVRKQFADFDYITIEPPFWAIMTTFLVTIAVNIGLSLWIVHNEHRDSGGLQWKR